MYSKENWQSMAEKEPPFGYDDNFQTSPKYLRLLYTFSRHDATDFVKTVFLKIRQEQTSSFREAIYYSIRRAD